MLGQYSVVSRSGAPVAKASPFSLSSALAPVKSPPLSSALNRMPGLVLAGGIACAADSIAARTALSPLLWAAVLGIGIRAIMPRSSSPGSRFMAGIAFAKARLLRLGIILYGVKLTVQHIASIGAAGLLTDLFTLCTALPLGTLLGTKILGLDAPLAVLISTGAAICGCSAVAATQPVVQAESHEVAAAVGTVVLCGTAAMFLYPFLYRTVPFLAADPRLTGIYTGASVHELAGVVAAGNAMGGEIATTAIVTKLVRVCMLAPCLLIMAAIPGLRVRRNGECSPVDDDRSEATSAEACVRARFPVPWFALAFVAVAALNSVLSIDPSIVKTASMTSATCLAMAMGALGFDTDLRKIRELGPRPIVLAMALWAWLLFGVGAVAKLLVALLP